MADPKIRYDIQATTEGDQDVARLARELEKLDQAIDPAAAARAKALAAEIDGLSAKRAAFTGFLEALSSANQASKNLDAASEALAKLEKQLESVQEPSRREAGQLQKLSDAAERAQAALTAQTAKLSDARSAAERLGLDTQQLSVTQQALAEAFKSTGAQAQQLVQGYQNTAQALAAVEREAQQAAKETAKLQSYFDKLKSERDLVDKAFGATGVRSIQAIEREVFELTQSLNLLQSELREGKVSIQDFDRATGAAGLRLKALKTEMQTVPGNSTVFAGLAESANNLISKFGALTGAVASLGFAFKPVLDSSIALEQTTRVLTTVSGSAEKAAEQIEFLRRASQQAGQSFDEIAKSYANFAASALQSGLSLNQVQDVFKSVTLAAGNLGLSTEQTKRALDALGQIASKGTVSMEELRQQLGDALPGVLPLLAKELGLTEKQLNQVVQAGNLLAREAIPAIGRSLQRLGPDSGGQVEGLVASWNRFLNVVKQAGVEVVDGPLGRAAGVLLGSLAGVIRDVSFVAGSASQAIDFLGKSVGALISLLANRDSSAFLENLDEAAQRSATRIKSLTESAYGAQGAARDLASAVKPLGDSFAALALSIDQADSAAKLNARTSLVRAEAAKQEAEAVNLLAALSANELAAAELRVQSAQQYAAAASRSAAAALSEADALRAGRDALLAKAGANEAEIKALEEVLKRRAEEIQQADAAAEKLLAVAGAARNAAAAAEDFAAKVGDQSRKLAAIASEATGAENAYQALLRQYEKGKATTDEVRAAAEALARAQGRLKDALNDLSDALQRRLGLMRAENELQRQGLQLELERARNDLAKAQQLGNETQARQQLIRIREIEVALSRKSIDLKRDEAAAELKELGLQEDILRKQGLLTEARSIEIETRRKQLQAIILEQAAKEESGKQAVQELQNLREGKAARDQSTGSVEKSTGATTTNTAARSSNAAAIEKQTVALGSFEQRLAALRGFDGGVSGDGIAGFTGQAGSTSITGVRNAGGEANRVNGLTPIESFGQLIRDTPSGGTTRTASGRQLTPPDSSGDWEFVNDAGYGAFQKADSLAYVVPGIGYWKRNAAAQTRVSSAGQQREAALRSGNFNLPSQSSDGSFSTPQGQAGQVNKDGTVTLNFNFGPGRSYGVTARSYAEAQGLARELEQQFAMSGGG